MPSPHKTALIKTVKERHIKAIRRSRNKASKLYQDWVVWTYGSSLQYIANDYAYRCTRALWIKLYNEKIGRNLFTNVMMTQYYLAESQLDFFVSRDFVAHGIEKGYIQPSWQSRVAYKQSYLDPMFAHHFLNNIEGKKAYVLTHRARLLINTYDRYLREYIQPSPMPPPPHQGSS